MSPSHQYGSLPTVDDWAESCEVYLRPVAGSILESPAFERLGGITFLGVLSPRYSKALPHAPDGSRQDHSRGVAVLAYELARRLALSPMAQRYAAAWGLLHDIATWPLSHTSEPAFEDIVGITSRYLRRAMILGSSEIPRCYRLREALDQMGLEAEKLVELFDATAEPGDRDLRILWQIIHSPITPDTLEGIWRAGLVFGVTVPGPMRLIAGIRCEGADAIVDCAQVPVVAEFWRAKAEVYDQFINSRSAVALESLCAEAILKRHQRLRKIERALRLTEVDLLPAIERARHGQLRLPFEEYRYKPPHKYFLNSALDRLPMAPSTVQDLATIFSKSPRNTAAYASAR